jgi:hypothetical protein
MKTKLQNGAHTNGKADAGANTNGQAAGTAAAAAGSDADNDELDPSVRQIDDLLSGNDLTQAKIRLHRRRDNETGFSYLATIDAKDFDFERIKLLYGGGEYQVALLNQENQYVKRRRFTIDKMFQGTIGAPPAAPDPAAAARPPGPADQTPNIMDRFSMMQSDNMKLMMTMMSESNKTMATVMAAAMGGGRGDGLSIKDVLTLLPILQGGKSEGHKLSDMLAVMRELKEMSAEDGDKGSSLIDKLAEMAPAAMAAFGGMRNAMQPAAPIAAVAEIVDTGAEQVAGNGVDRPARRPAPPEPETAVQVVMKVVLIGARKADSDPELYADLVLDQLDDTQIGPVKNVLTNDNWKEFLFGQLPDAEKVGPWLESVRALILKAFSEHASSDETNQPNGHAAGGGNSSELQSEAGAGGVN